MKRLLSFIAFAMMATQSAFGADRVHVVQRTEAESYTDADGVTRVKLVPKTYVSVISDVAPPPVVVKAVPVVTAKPTFQSGSYHAGHRCPTCGRTQTTIYGGGKGGRHTHRCPYDGTVWSH